jgi:hypothetical protein
VSSALNGVQHGVQLFGETGGFGRHWTDLVIIIGMEHYWIPFGKLT